MATDPNGNKTRLERLKLSESDGFPDRLKSAMRVAPSLRAFARDVGISDSVLRQYLSGKSEPTRPVLIALASAAGVDLAWLATGEGRCRQLDEGGPIPVEDLPVESMRTWLLDWWRSASKDERVWLQIEMARCFPEYADWKKKTGPRSSGQCGA